MSLPKVYAAYEDCYTLFDQALEAPKGARARFTDKGMALNFRARMNQARVLDRENSARIYDKIDPRWGKSSYDKLVVRIMEDTEGFSWVYVEPRSASLTHVELIEDDYDEVRLAN